MCVYIIFGLYPLWLPWASKLNSCRLGWCWDQGPPGNLGAAGTGQGLVVKHVVNFRPQKLHEWKDFIWHHCCCWADGWKLKKKIYIDIYSKKSLLLTAGCGALDVWTAEPPYPLELILQGLEPEKTKTNMLNIIHVRTCISVCRSGAQGEAPCREQE